MLKVNDDDNDVNNNKDDGQRSNFVGSGELKIIAVNFVTLLTETYGPFEKHGMHYKENKRPVSHIAHLRNSPYQ